MDWKKVVGITAVLTGLAWIFTRKAGAEPGPTPPPEPPGPPEPPPEPPEPPPEPPGPPPPSPDIGYPAGMVRAGDTGARLSGAIVVIGGVTGYTDADGIFRMEAPAGSQQMTISYPGYETLTKYVDIVKDQGLNLGTFYLLPTGYAASYIDGVYITLFTLGRFPAPGYLVYDMNGNPISFRYDNVQIWNKDTGQQTVPLDPIPMVRYYETTPPPGVPEGWVYGAVVNLTGIAVQNDAWVKEIGTIIEPDGTEIVLDRVLDPIWNPRRTWPFRLNKYGAYRFRIQLIVAATPANPRAVQTIEVYLGTVE